MKKTYIMLFLVFSLIPSLLMPVFGHQEGESSSHITVLPAVFDEGKLNMSYFKDLGDYFSDNFAFRSQMVTADNLMKAKVFHTSGQENVVLGKEGYLFYGSSLNDYFGNPTMSDLQIAEAAYNLKLMQKTLKEMDVKFLFTIAPNKNSLYPQFMPSAYKQNAKTKNAVRLSEALKKNKVSYYDLFAMFNGKDEVYYHKTDSHWNNIGAAMAMDGVLTKLKKEHTDYSQLSYKIRHDFQGDLAHMLYPQLKDHEAEAYYDHEMTYTYVDDITSTYDLAIETENPEKEGRVIVCRDSFGNSWLPFLADEYEAAYFTRSLPYPLYEYEEREADTVIIELVERNLIYLQTYAPKLASEAIDNYKVPKKANAAYQGTMAIEDDEPFIKITGTMDGKYLDEKTKTYVRLYDAKTGTDYVFPAYHSSEEKLTEHVELGYCAYIDPGFMEEGHYDVSLLTEYQGEKILSPVYTTYDVIQD